MGFAFIMTFDLMYFLNPKINYFNIGVFPTLIGIGDDCGLHFYCHWKENNRDVRKTQRDLFVPLTLTTLTTMIGYFGITFVHHPGLKSIGITASIGLLSIWFSSLFILPGILKWFHPEDKTN